MGKTEWAPEFWQGAGWYAQRTWVRQDNRFDSTEAPEPFWAPTVYEIGLVGGVPDGCELAIDYLGDREEPESDGERFWFDPETVPDAFRGRYPGIASESEDEPSRWTRCAGWSHAPSPMCSSQSGRSTDVDDVKQAERAPLPYIGLSEEGAEKVYNFTEGDFAIFVDDWVRRGKCNGRNAERIAENAMHAADCQRRLDLTTVGEFNSAPHGPVQIGRRGSVWFETTDIDPGTEAAGACRELSRMILELEARLLDREIRLALATDRPLGEPEGEDDDRVRALYTEAARDYWGWVVEADDEDLA